MAKREYSGAGFQAEVWDQEKEYENFDVVPMKFKSKQAMRDFCKLKGWSTGALL